MTGYWYLKSDPYQKFPLRKPGSWIRHQLGKRGTHGFPTAVRVRWNEDPTINAECWLDVDFSSGICFTTTWGSVRVLYEALQRWINLRGVVIDFVGYHMLPFKGERVFSNWVGGKFYHWFMVAPAFREPGCIATLHTADGDITGKMAFRWIDGTLNMQVGEWFMPLNQFHIKLLKNELWVEEVKS